ncbi:RRXRR domain-containing protein [Cupriavidus basilensis]
MAVIVLERSGHASMPRSEKRARQRSERGRACEHRLMPFPIRLDDRCRADCIIQPMRIKLDPGCKVTGTAVVHEVNANGAALRRHAVARFLAELTPHRANVGGAC